MSLASRCVVWTALLSSASIGVAHAGPSATISELAGATDLTLDGGGSASTHIVHVADLSISTEASRGFTLSITWGLLTRTSGGNPISFRVVAVPAGGAPPSSSAFTVPSGAVYAVSTAGPGTMARDLYIMYEPASLQSPGAYAASIDAAVVDN